ncbi:polyprenyl synthetase family protein [Heyndrickxia ginsengihumi]|uniref:Farnesyl diphosphate synthase n=2 Tax=Heyndrickxia ginsengihumi TaxID=363870 RepID=A0A0A6Y128_9BACI|nr:farnesyl diphosphate synthase [Heyndrickxia ginsengihumi]KHD85992.1 farnesyl-diphosphate synthase [Heyndrickxia ginsengihumi]MCM3022816.1 polyprenyl synthetase family protein [Heyndrickxia ginsengihumi]
MDDLRPYIKKVESQLVQEISALNAPFILKEAMNYSLQAGGKRIRPLLLLSTIHALGEEIEKGIQAACSLEMIHTYSLIHDDLPAMDNDDLRRGKPTNHKVFGEAIAILAGDGLLTYSFQCLAKDPLLTLEQKVALLELLAQSAGPEGMVGGQVADMEGENKSLTLEELQYIHENKTGKLLSYSVLAGAIIGGATEEQQALFHQFSQHLGLAFQIQDDILDIEGDQEKIGKPVGSDQSNHKSTYPSLLTLEGAKEKLKVHIEAAQYFLKQTKLDITFLNEITQLIAQRDH